MLNFIKKSINTCLYGYYFVSCSMKNFNEIVKLNKEGYSLNTICDKLGIKNYQTVQCYLKRKNLKLEFNNKGNVFSKNEYFKNISTEIQAYLLGFFYADGCLYDKNRFGLCISETDEYIINLFKFEISPDSFVKKVQNNKGAKNRQPQLIWRVTNKYIIQDLEKLGVKIGKTLEGMNFPDIPKELYSHFIRGVFDGDGCCSRRKYSNVVSITCTDLKFLKKIQEILSLKNIKTSIYSTQGKTVIHHRLETTNKLGGSNFYNFVYENANYFLQRKKNKFYNLIPR